MSHVETIYPETNLLIVCETCGSLVIQMRGSKFDQANAILRLRGHESHKRVTFNRINGRYSINKQMGFKEEYVQ